MASKDVVGLCEIVPLENSNWKPDSISQSSSHSTYAWAAESQIISFASSSVTLFLSMQLQADPPSKKLHSSPCVGASEARVLEAWRDLAGAGWVESSSTRRKVMLILTDSPPKHSGLTQECSFAIWSGPVYHLFNERFLCSFLLVMLCRG